MTHITIERAKLEKMLKALKSTSGLPHWPAIFATIADFEQALAAPVQDAEGENKAVRCFLMLYGQAGLTVGQMKKHMAMSGFKSWPVWVDADEMAKHHLTKAGAQLWLRHLFSLEATPPAGEKP